MIQRRTFIEATLLGGAGLLSAPTLVRAADPWAELPAILRRIHAPVFQKRDFAIAKYGAIGDGKTDCTEAFRRAIAACHKAGGGRVIVPAGEWTTGPIHLKSNVNLHVSKGATIKFSRDPKAYLPLVFTRWEGVELMNYSPFIYAFEQRNIAITGAGTLDGQADCEHWWPWKGRTNCGWKAGDPKQDAARDRLFEMGERNVPVSERRFGEGHFLRPQFIQPYRCQNVLIEGVTIVNSPMWEIHPVLCRNVTVRGVRIVSHGPNNDGCDPESCTDVLIENCYFDTGDDCIAIKSGRNGDGRRVNAPCENLVIRNCEMKDGHGGVTIGSEISGGVRNVFAENCRMDSPHLERALRLKTNAVRGGTLENIHMRNVRIGQVSDAIVSIDFNYEEGAAGDFMPTVRNVSVRDVTSAKSNYALYLRGFERAPISNIRLENCTFASVARASVYEYAHDVASSNMRINGATPTRIVLVGDSTVTEGSGWGVGFREQCRAEVECINLARNGRSSRSYLAEGHWKIVLAQRPAYVLIQFGHNDQPGKGPERETDARTTYKDFLRRYVDEARAAGAIPILITSLARRNFKDDKIAADILTDYAAAAREVAAEKNAPLIDLSAMSIALLNEIGPKAAAAFDVKNKDGSPDRTHLSRKGSATFGKLVVEELGKVAPELKPLLKNGIT
jgi:polygalacturonase/lysophospholipase L1-like esterase